MAYGLKTYPSIAVSGGFTFDLDDDQPVVFTLAEVKEREKKARKEKLENVLKSKL